jgi:hypothetical protein
MANGQSEGLAFLGGDLATPKTQTFSFFFFGLLGVAGPPPGPWGWFIHPQTVHESPLFFFLFFFYFFNSFSFFIFYFLIINILIFNEFYVITFNLLVFLFLFLFLFPKT